MSPTNRGNSLKRRAVTDRRPDPHRACRGGELPESYRQRPPRHVARSTAGWSRASRRQGRFRFLRLEVLEPRRVLGGLGGADDGSVSAEWFAAVPQIVAGVQDLPTLAASGAFDPAAANRPVQASRWIVRLAESAMTSAGSVRPVEHLLDTVAADFQVIRGLGLPGQVLVRSFAPDEIASAALTANANVAAFEPERLVSAQLLPDDVRFDELTGLHNFEQYGGTDDADIDAPEAWAIQTGSRSVVVGVIDSGIDLTHPDLYLNVWINQLEIRPSLAAQLTDVDGDQLISFVDLNDPANASLVTERPGDGNDYVEAEDLLADYRWADGFDTDGNGFVDDFFGWNFRRGTDEAFAPNDPGDANGHGTHVAGTIGAVGNNGRGVTGVNWATSLMALKVLGADNQGLMSDAILAVNYATMMRTRQSGPVNVAVLNNSWGQTGAFSPTLRMAIEAAGEANLLFVAAAGNGNILGRGVDNDTSPFYPASYEPENVLSVAATDADDRLASFSNFGVRSVDLAAPGVGVLSTLPGGRYGTLNGTSMATPHVSGVAALLWSEMPDATVAEVRKAILDGADALSALAGRVASGGRLNAYDSLNSDDFAPRAVLTSAPNITVSGGTANRIVVEYTDRIGMALASVNDDDLVVTRSWNSSDTIPVTLVSAELSADGKRITASYDIPAPGGTWDGVDFGEYRVQLISGQIANLTGLVTSARDLGAFQVRIEDASVIYVNSFEDAADANVGDGIAQDAQGRTTLRAAVQEANVAGRPMTVILGSGLYTRTVTGSGNDWNDAQGDLDIAGDVTVLGSDSATTIIDAAQMDRVFEVLPGGGLHLERVTVTGGDGGWGGGVLNYDWLTITDSVVRGNTAHRGGGIAIAGWATAYTPRGAVLLRTVIDSNTATGWWNQSYACYTGVYGGGIYHDGGGDLHIRQSVVTKNTALYPDGYDPCGWYGHGGGLYGSATVIVDSTFSENRANYGGAIYNGTGDIVGSTFSGNIGAYEGAVHGVFNITNSTISGNSAIGLYLSNSRLNHVTVAFNGGSGVYSTSQVYFRNTIAVGNGTDPALSAWDVSVAFPASLGNNLIGPLANGGTGPFDQPGDQVLTSAAQYLSPLQDNGGPTWTHALLPGSSAIDGGNANPLPWFPGQTTDQRGVSRANAGSGAGNPAPDIGAYERRTAELHGTLFHDLDKDRARDTNEPGVSGRTIYLDLNENGMLDSDEPVAVTAEDDPKTVMVNEVGNYSFTGLEPLIYRVSQYTPDGWQQTVAGPGAMELASPADDGTQITAPGIQFFLSAQYAKAISISGDGRYVSFTSAASDVVSGDTNESQDVFVFDRRDDRVERVSLGVSGAQANAHSYSSSLSADGRYVAFSSDASNLISGDTNAATDVFVYDRKLRQMERVSVAGDGTQANGGSYLSAINGDGRFVLFQSSATNLMPGGQAGWYLFDRQARTIESVPNGSEYALTWEGRYLAYRGADSHIYVFDRDTRATERVDRSYDGSDLPGARESGGISADGRYVAFLSGAEKVVLGDVAGTYDVFVYDRETQTTDWVSKAEDGTPANAGYWCSVSMSSDSRYVAALSSSSNLVPDDTNGIQVLDVFVFDRVTRQVERLNVPASGAQSTGLDLSDVARISADGRYVAFTSSASDLVANDLNATYDAFVRSTAAAAEAPSFKVDLGAGRVLTGIDFGTLALSGEIRGQHFADPNRNGVKDFGEDGLSDWTVFLDLDEDGRFDVGEPSAVTDAQGNYAITEVPPLATYTVALVPQDDWTQTFPGADTGGVWTVYVDAGAVVEDRDFGSREGGAEGQSNEASVAGIVFRDDDGDGQQDGGELGIAGLPIFLDLNDDGQRQYDEPRTATGADGGYSIPGLGNRYYTVRLTAPEHHRQSAPFGNAFTTAEFTLDATAGTLAGPLDVLAADFNGDGRPDLAAALAGTNAVAVLVNDGSGGFVEPAVSVPLAPGGLYPVALASGQFNGAGSLDLAVVNSLNSKVTILIDFTGSGFAARHDVAVGVLPQGIDAGDLDGDGDLDLIVTSEASDSLTVLRNDGAGVFSADTLTIPVGDSPYAVVAARLDGDDDLDLAVANFGSYPSGSDRGHLSILLNDGIGHFGSAANYTAGTAPAKLVVEDLDGDGQRDLAAMNFLSNDITVRLGQGDGTFGDPLTFAAGDGPTDLGAADMDGDGDLDLAVANANAKTVSILRNTFTQRGFGVEPPEAYGVANFPAASRFALAVGDLDGDGTPDLAVTDTSRNTVSVQSNRLVAGAHRTALTGTERVSGLDFGLEPLDTTLKVATLTATRTGFVAQFNRDLTASVLNLYDQGGALGPADVTLSGATAGPVRGSLVVAPNLREITFIKTGSVLAADTYTVTLLSGANAFRDADGNLLDGNGDGTAGDNDTSTFVVPSAPAGSVTVSLPDFARGYGQPVNLPANVLTAGIPLQLSDGSAVSRLQFTLRYDPSLLEVQAFTLSSSLVERGAAAQFQVVSPGQATLDITAASGFAAASGLLTVGTFTAIVPPTAAYGAKHVLDISGLHVFDTAGVPAELPAVDDDAIHVAAFFGDNNGSRTYNAPDVTLNQRLIGLINTGLGAYQLADPLLLADITLNSRLQANDTVSIQRVIGQVPVANVPPLPTGLTPPAASGADPKMYMPQDLSGSPGDSVAVPVQLQVTEAAGITLSGFDLAIEFDPARFTVRDAQLGNLFDTLDFVGMWTDPAPGRLIYTASSASGTGRLVANTEGSLVVLTLTIESGAAAGPSALNLLASFQTTATAAFDNGLNELVLAPPPSNAADDSVDGLLTVRSSPPGRPPAQNAVQPLDTNEDGEVTPADALAVINYLNAGLPQDAAVLYVLPGRAVTYGDVNGDRRITAQDVLEVVNHLNARTANGGEGEAHEGALWTLLDEEQEDEQVLWELLAEDQLGRDEGRADFNPFGTE